MPDGMIPWLARTIEMEPTAAGPGALTADGLTVLYADVGMGNLGDPARPETMDVLRLAIDQDGCVEPPRRCVDGTVRAFGSGPTSDGIVAQVTAETVRPG